MSGLLSNSLFLSTAAGGGAGYQIERSLRFNAPDSAYLSRTPGSAGNRKTWTWAGWVKKVKNESILPLLNARQSYDDFLNIWFDTGDGLFINSRVGGSNSFLAYTAAVFRDPSAWYHVLIAIDTTQASGSNGVKVYVNGTQQALTIPTYNQNADTYVNSTHEHRIGYLINQNSSTYYLDSYLADAYLIDGQQLTPSAFGEFDTNGVWQPIDASGLTYGTNGFHLPFSDNSTAAALGTDSSSNGNNWTPNNLSPYTGGPFSIAASTGGLPIWNATDSYGAIIGTGLRTDSNASSLALAAPFTTSGSNALTDDELPTGRTSPAKTLTASGSITNDSSIYRLYGSAALFSTGAYYGLNDSAFNFGTSNFTIECWVYLTAAGSLVSTNLSSLATTTLNVRISTGAMEVYTSGGSEFLSMAGVVPASKWCHVAISRSGSTMRAFVDGTLVGTNAFWSMNLSDSGNLYINSGRDTSGQRRIQDFRVYTGLAKYTSSFVVPTSTQNTTVAVGCDSLVDSPTNGSQVDTGVGGEVVGNYATFNPLRGDGFIGGLTNGNLDVRAAATGNDFRPLSTIGVSSGKWYWEVTKTYAGSSSTDFIVGIANATDSGATYSSGSQRTDPIDTVYGVSIDFDTLTFAIKKDNVALYSTSIVANTYFAFVDVFFFGAAASATVNFGQRPFAYTAPSGFKALCTTNLPTPTIADGSTAMDVKLYTGNSSTQTISGLNFSPDLVWIKNRAAADNHKLTDTVRGATEELESNTADAEVTNADGLTAFNSDGFDLGDDDEYNTSSEAYAAWCWDAGSSTVTNTEGSISSQVRANASAGFSIVTYTGTGANATVGHGLGVAPSMILVKARTALRNWPVYHASAGANAYTYLDGSFPTVTSNTVMWQGTAPTSTIFSVGTYAENNGTYDYVAYCFAPVAGYSAMGSYVGNGSSDGVFVYTGFRPRFILFKNASATSGWNIFDTARDTYNAADKYLVANSSVVESSGTPIFDMLSNGFKVRDTWTDINGSGNTIIYAAFAESPFQYARAR